MARKQPQRTCAGCKAVKAKKELLRIVRVPDGELMVDSTGKRSGRGAYICPDEACLEKAFKTRGLEKTLKEKLSPEVTDRLKSSLLTVLEEARKQEELVKKPRKRGKL